MGRSQREILHARRHDGRIQVAASRELQIPIDFVLQLVFRFVPNRKTRLDAGRAKPIRVEGTAQDLVHDVNVRRLREGWRLRRGKW
eukprot:7064063-Pyramimonas_sp.AAC.1